MGRLAVPLLAALAAAALLPACGAERQRAPRLPPPAEPAGSRTVDLREYGLSFRRPANWPLAEAQLPQLAGITSGRAVIAVWRYRRLEQLPRGAGELERARRALIAAARARDRTLKVVSSRTLRVSTQPAVEVVATERVGAGRRRVRSTHVYAHGQELVLDAYAPIPEFARVDREVFRPLLASVRIRRPARP
jgi:hypothetical protein